MLVMLCLIMTACSRQTKSFEITIDDINKNEFIVNCSIEANKHKKGNQNDLGYSCNIVINSSTNLMDSEGNPLRLIDFSVGDLIRIILTKPQVINERNRTLDATEIVLLDAKQ